MRVPGVNAFARSANVSWREPSCERKKEHALEVIQRSILIEAPVAVVYRHWRGLGEDGGLAPEIARAQVTADEPDRRLCWEAAGAQVRAIETTFAPLEGDCTWMVFRAELAGGPGAGEGEVTSLSRTIAEALRDARDQIEGQYSESAKGIG